MIRLPVSGSELGRCLCGSAILEDFWRDECSEREWSQSGLCQDCQDKIFLGQADVRSHALRFGVLTAHASSGCAMSEVAVIPFLFVPATGTVAWEARFTLRIGSMLPFGLLSDLEPMARILHGHWLRLTEVYPADPRLDKWFSDLDLLVALDQESLQAIVGVCPVLGGGIEVALADALDWRALVGRPLTPFPQFVRSVDLDPSRRRAGPRPSPLRVCARMGAALGLEDGRPLTQLLELLEPHLRTPSNPKGG